MMEAYGQKFARFYNLKCSGFANEVGPRILDFYKTTAIGLSNTKILDLCCGAGHLSVILLQHGYQVTGLDLSESMLKYARINAQPYIQAGQAQFVHDDATKFELGERFGLVISTYDALNHLEDEEALKACFERVYQVSGGYFIFDLNTQKGLQRWNSIQVDESEEMIIIVHKTFYQKLGKARAKFSCFLRTTDGLYERVEESVFNTLFVMDKVKEALLETGWQEIYFARISNLREPIAEPEQERRVFIVARK